MKSFFLGTTGIGAIQGVSFIPPATPTIEIVKVAIQIFIGIVTIFKMIKKPKNEENKND